MWLITEQGFASVVSHRDREGVLLVRARARGDLESFCRVAREEGIAGLDPEAIWEDPSADYRSPLEADREAVGPLARVLVERIEYDNFKSKVGARDPDREAIYHGVWAELSAIQRSG